MAIMMDKAKKGMSVIVEDKHELYAGTVTEIDPPAGEVGVRRESTGESQLVSFTNLHLSFRKGNGARPFSPPNNAKTTDLEAYIVAIGKGQINPASLNEIATLIEGKGPVREVRTQELLRYYR